MIYETDRTVSVRCSSSIGEIYMLTKNDFLTRFAYLTKEKSLLEILRDYCGSKLKHRNERIDELVAFHEKNEVLLVQQLKERTIRSKSASPSPSKIIADKFNTSRIPLKTPEKIRHSSIENLNTFESQKSQFSIKLPPCSPVFKIPCPAFKRKYQYKFRKDQNDKNKLNLQEKMERFKRVLEREFSFEKSNRKIKVENFLQSLKK